MARPALAAAFLLAVGLPPAWAITRRWALAVPLSALTAGLVLSPAVALSLVTATALWPWVLLCTIGGWGLAAASARHRQAPATAPGPSLRTLAVAALVSSPVLAGATAAPTEYDAKAIWFFHARWSWLGGAEVRHALANPALGYTHQDYPPLVPGTTASLWSLVSGGDLRLAQWVTSLQTWAAVLLLAVLLVWALGRSAEWPLAALGGVFVVACYGVAGGFGTRGYADLLWTGAAVSGAVAVLVLPTGPGVARLGAACFAAAALTKGEGLVLVAGVLIPMAALRWWRRDGRAALAGIGLLAAAVLLAATWPLLVGRYITEPMADITTEGAWSLLRGDPGKVDRLEPALRGLWPYARTTFLGAGVVIVAGLRLTRAERRARGLGGGLWLPVAAVAAFATFVLVLAAGNLEVATWARDGGFRAMTVGRTLLLAEVFLVAGLCLDRLRPPPVRRLAPARDGTVRAAGLPTPSS